jgi:hypothetical protein
MSEEKTIYTRCSSVTNDLLDAIRKAGMPPRSRNSQIIYLIHKEAKKLGLDSHNLDSHIKKQENHGEIAKDKKEDNKAKSGLQGLAGTRRQANFR